MVKKRSKLVKKYKSGYLNEVINPKGKKRSVYLFQGDRRGYTAAYSSTHRRLSGSSMNAERYAVRLAKKGHKKVTFRD